MDMNAQVPVDVDRISTNNVVMDYQTPNCPNLQFWHSISEMYPTLNINVSYFEGGINEGGRFNVENGIINDDEVVNLTDGSSILEMADYLESINMDCWADSLRECAEEDFNGMTEEQYREAEGEGPITPFTINKGNIQSLLTHYSNFKSYESMVPPKW
tara:strand:- start:62 stop:535 length:474 start_codon:yes stop_codon:yes gene_type:complete